MVDDKGFCWKAKSCGWWSKHRLCGIALCNVDSRASHPGCEPETGEDIREGMRLFLARSGIGDFTRPSEFDLCGCWCGEAPRLDRTIRVRWSHLLAHLRPKGRGNALFRHYNPHRVDRPCRSMGQLRLFLWLGLESLESVEDDPLPRFTDGNPISKYVTLRFWL